MGEYLQHFEVASMMGRGNQFANNLVRLAIIPYKLESQQLDARQINFLKKTKLDSHYEFVVGESLFEQFSHTWSEFQNVAGRAGQVAQKYNEMLQQSKAVGGMLTGGEQGVEASRIKIDTPLMYENSDRRKLNITVNLRDFDDPSAINGVVGEFKRYGSAKIGENDAMNKIEFPYIFKIYSLPQQFIYIEDACLNAVQVTYNNFQGNKGLAASIDMILEFQDMRPLYEKSFASEATVTTALG